LGLYSAFGPVDREGDKPDLLRSITADDLGDWILTFQGKGSDSVAHAVAKWQETHSTPWLMRRLQRSTPTTLGKGVTG